MTDQLPIFYSFRRCPYAMRARLALAYSNVQLEHREIILKNKPAPMLEASPKGTVPVLVLVDGTVIDESLDIMLWALAKNDPDHWLPHKPQPREPAQSELIMTLIEENDQVFKKHLDRYKYADRFPEHPQSFYREQGELFLQKLDERLAVQPFLMSEQITLADMAIAPFVRQFAHVDRDWFYQSRYQHLQRWLTQFLASDLFQSIMKKKPLWKA
ncbi:glutathione S-transferase [Endozoicomonas sp. OPT23]|uniref:glutathione S-transferase n=1 Tax=Endozoicomonas sp. OPT23 TaxID=2072845 RepID=UPI001DEAF692|nr:glutathione S-transferase [Endozoicomonas sp. OPT23]